MTTLATRLRQAGLELAGPLGPATDGARWAVRDADGNRWSVTVVTDEGPEERARLRARIARLSRLHHPHLAAVGPLVDLADGALAVLHEEIPGTDLATVAAARGPWSPGEVVTVVVPLAEALAALHDAGLAHGDVAPGNVVLRPDGRPVLVDVVCADGPRERGTPGMAAPERSGGADAAGDVHALARMGLRLLAGPVDDAVVPGRAALLDRLAGAAAVDPAQRPGARELARLVYDACPPEAVAMPDAAVLARLALRRLAVPDAELRTIRTARGRHRRSRRVDRPLLILVAAVVLGAWAATATIAGNRATAETGRREGSAGSVGEWQAGPDVDEGSAADRLPADPGAPGDPATAAVRLTAWRARALATGDVAALSAVTVPGSPAAFADLRAVRRVGGDLGPVAVRVDRLVRWAPPHGGVTHGGSAGDAGHVGLVLLTAWVGPIGETGSPDARATTVLLVLHRLPPGWRVSEVLAVPG